MRRSVFWLLAERTHEESTPMPQLSDDLLNSFIAPEL